MCVCVCLTDVSVVCADNKEQVSVILSFEPVTPAELFMEQMSKATHKKSPPYTCKCRSHQAQAHVYTHTCSDRIIHVESSCPVLISTR